ncbi:MAG: rhomboid family intramembrane serine protease [Gemmatimonadota bacterium]|nr:rhomboid family intramembrane serine protease [Gemmatimonadota bacterium]
MTPWVRWLLMANVGVYLLQLAFPGATGVLAFIPYQMLIHPWTLFTYMFVHDPTGFTHILFNMIALFFFGPRVEAFLGSQRFITLYLISGVMGGLVSVVFTPMSAIIGASGAVYGVMLGFARFWPRERLMIWGIIPVEARWLVVLTTVYALYSGFSGNSGGVANFAHLGGYVGAYAYLKWVEKRAPSKQWEKKLKGPAASSIPLGDWKQLDMTKVHEANRDEVNRILDKINAGGVNSLTAQEKTFLQHFVPTPSPKLPS